MTKPVAYMWKTVRGTIVGLKPNDDNHSQGVFGRIPLYTKEQLHPRVKMTQAEFDEWKELFDDYEFFSDAFSQGVTIKENVGIFKKIYATKDKDLSALEIEAKFATLWANFNIDNQEEMIAIVPNMKWFVRTKEFDDGVYKVLEDIRLDYYEYGNVENDEETAEYGHRFDTKEEADLWTNPLTEAVQLPVEEE